MQARSAIPFRYQDLGEEKGSKIEELKDVAGVSRVEQELSIVLLVRPHKFNIDTTAMPTQNQQLRCLSSISVRAVSGRNISFSQRRAMQFAVQPLEEVAISQSVIFSVNHEPCASLPVKIK